MFALLRVVAHDLNRVCVPQVDRLVVDFVFIELLLDADQIAVNFVAILRVLEKFRSEVHHNHHVLQIIVVWKLGRPRHSSIFIEYRPVVLVHVQTLANVAPLFLTKSLLFDFLPVLDAGSVSYVCLFLVIAIEISFLFLRVNFADLNDKMVWNARDILNRLTIMRVHRLWPAHG